MRIRLAKDPPEKHKQGKCTHHGDDGPHCGKCGECLLICCHCPWSALATPTETRRFTRWLSLEEGKRPPRKRFQVQLNFEMAGVNPYDMVLFLELVDQVSRSAMETHDVPFVRLRNVFSDGRRII